MVRTLQRPMVIVCDGVTRDLFVFSRTLGFLKVFTPPRPTANDGESASPGPFCSLMYIASVTVFFFWEPPAQPPSLEA